MNTFQGEISYQEEDASIGRSIITLSDDVMPDDVMFGMAVESRNGASWSGIEWIRCVYDETRRAFVKLL